MHKPDPLRTDPAAPDTASDPPAFDPSAFDPAASDPAASDPAFAYPGGVDPVAADTASEGSWFGRLATSAEGVYGLIVVAGLIVVNRDPAGSSAEAMLSTAATLLVFFAAHVYASLLSWLATSHGRGKGFALALRHGVQESAGMVLVGAVPVLILGLGAIGLVRDADAAWLALIVDVLLLGLLGWFIAAIRTDRIWVRLSSALVTAAFGGALIVLKAAVHH